MLKIIDPKSLNRCFSNWVQSLLPTKQGLTLSVDGKTIRSTEKMGKYEIPAVQKLLSLLDIEGCLVVADALNCQKDTAKAIVKGKSDYLVSVKDNHPTLKKDLEDYIQDDSLRRTMDIYEVTEKNRGRIERRTAYPAVN